ncbi:MAG: transglutaminase-like domain-containing protein [Clostridiales bacterium]|jgi:hypothetical protein|nr:transglutaminase-like domain-containing protein [Clostridiales bacterium]
MGKTIIRILMLSALFTLIPARSLFASANIDVSKASKGVVSVQYSGDLSKGIKVVVEKSGDKYIYALKNADKNNYPLQMGAGNYVISVMENVSGNSYRPLGSKSVSVADIDEMALYTSSISVIDFASSKSAIPYFDKLADGVTGVDKINAIYEDIVKGYSYDFDKAKKVQTDYVPVIDDTFKVKKGICYDYSSLFSGALRQQGVPTRMVFGYAPNVKQYHAWSEVYTDGEWRVVDTTSDSQLAKAKAKYTFAKDASKYKAVKIY